MGLSCCQKCKRYSFCERKWLRGEQHAPQLCCPVCESFFLCKKGGKGVDIGTAFIKCAHKTENEIILKKQRNAFLEIKYTNFTKSILERMETTHLQKEDEIYIIGDESLEFAAMFTKEMRRPLRQGVISPKEKEASMMLELLIKSIVGKAGFSGEIVYYSIPGEPVDAELSLFYHEQLLSGFLHSLGYTPRTINEGQAVILAELAQEDFTGIGISFGGGMVNVCFSFMSVPIVKFSVTRAGDWIDQQVALATDEPASTVCAIKESSLDILKEDGGNKIETILAMYYGQLIEYVIEHIKLQFSQNNKMPHVQKPVTIVLAGGTSLPGGFVERFSRVLEKVSLPIPVGEVRLAKHPLSSVVRGALLAASAEGE